MYLTLIWLVFLLKKLWIDGVESILPISVSRVLILIGLDIIIYNIHKIKQTGRKK